MRVKLPFARFFGSAGSLANLFPLFPPFPPETLFRPPCRHGTCFVSAYPLNFLSAKSGIGVPYKVVSRIYCTMYACRHTQAPAPERLTLPGCGGDHLGRGGGMHVMPPCCAETAAVKKITPRQTSGGDWPHVIIRGCCRASRLSLICRHFAKRPVHFRILACYEFVTYRFLADFIGGVPTC
jgi:hypothetical protein